MDLLYSFRDPSLLRMALTHSSLPRADGEMDNQRLEFLGDAVLELCVSRALYERFPEADEGLLTQMRSTLVCEQSLCGAAQRLGLGPHLRMAHGERASGGHEKPSILADAFEALLAAVYLDGGFEAAEALAAWALEGYVLPRQSAGGNWKSLLQERVQALGHPAPRYEMTACEGPAHAPRFVATVHLGDRLLGQGSGKSKKEAEQQAAKAALQQEETDLAPEETGDLRL